MIAVVGQPALRDSSPPSAGGRASEVAIEAVRCGSRVELIGTCGEDSAGDALLLALAAAGVGHAATLRDPARATPVIAAPPTDDGDAEPTAGPDATEYAHDSGHPTLDAADVALGLAYLTSFAVLVVTDDVPPAALRAAIEAATFSGAHLVLLVADGTPLPDGLPEAATALAAPAADDEGAFGTLVGAYAAGLDLGATPAAAFADATGRSGWEALVTDRG